MILCFISLSTHLLEQSAWPSFLKNLWLSCFASVTPYDSDTCRMQHTKHFNTSSLTVTGQTVTLEWSGGLPGNLVVSGEAWLNDGLPAVVLHHPLDLPGVRIRSWEAVLVLLQLYRCPRAIEGWLRRVCGFCSSSGSSCGQEVFQSVGIEEVLI